MTRDRRLSSSLSSLLNKHNINNNNSTRALKMATTDLDNKRQPPLEVLTGCPQGVLGNFEPCLAKSSHQNFNAPCRCRAGL
ncbi:hypothetical protein Y032_0004g1946 [Ancylostoma ceylanicum]|uniref:Uncharacterized protein n=1 Tax=Ancylostoma ceylanicum TaxID=53326 RepID=A0A016VUW0_9BILA|nr:hypothetical protein Y032_0004g1946 [Ancylostoma ceylanicum]